MGTLTRKTTRNWKQEEIQDAARSLQIQKYQTEQVQNPLKFKRERSKIKKIFPKTKLVQRVSNYDQKPKRQIQRLNIQQIPQKFQQQDKNINPIKTVQKISEYGKEEKPKGKMIIFIFIFILLILFGILASVFLFKNELMEFLNNIF